jgi:hypothetical protein
MAKMEGDEEEEEDFDEDEEFKENRPPSSLATQSEIEGTVANDLDALFDTEEEAEDEGKGRQIFWKNICRSSK